MSQENEKPESAVKRLFAGRNKKQEEPKEKKSLGREIFEWIMVFVVAGALALTVRTLIFEPVRVDGQSMMDTLLDGEFMIATKFDYLLGNPERFDIVICYYPNVRDHKYRVKRVIGLPGDEVYLKGDDLYVNGELVEQPFPKRANTLKDYYIEKVPEGQYVLFGDNRGNSRDTRDVGLIPRGMIKGHVRAVVFPFSKFQIMEY